MLGSLGSCVGSVVTGVTGVDTGAAGGVDEGAGFDAGGAEGDVCCDAGGALGLVVAGCAPGGIAGFACVGGFVASRCAGLVRGVGDGVGV